MEAAATIGLVWDGPATTKELKALVGAADLYDATHIQAWAGELLDKYSRHLARRSLTIEELTAELRCIRAWPSDGLVTADQATELEKQARSKMYQATPQREPSAPPSFGTGPCGEDPREHGKGRVAAPSFKEPAATRSSFSKNVVRRLVVAADR